MLFRGGGAALFPLPIGRIGPVVPIVGAIELPIAQCHVIVSTPLVIAEYFVGDVNGGNEVIVGQIRIAVRVKLLHQTPIGLLNLSGGGSAIDLKGFVVVGSGHGWKTKGKRAMIHPSSTSDKHWPIRLKGNLRIKIVCEPPL